MDKKTKMLLGVGVLAVAGYLLWKQSQKPKAFANLAAAPDCKDQNQVGCKCPCKNKVGTAQDGTTLCANGHTCCGDKLGACPPGATAVE
jgi:hypothetical protein